MKIISGKEYRIKGKSRYFKDKYGTSNPVIRVEDTDEKVFGKSWAFNQGNPACMLFAMRAGLEGICAFKKVYYGKVDFGEHGATLGELVGEDELEEV